MALQSRGDLGKEGGQETGDDDGGDGLSFITISTSKTQNLHRRGEGEDAKLTELPCVIDRANERPPE